LSNPKFTEKQKIFYSLFGLVCGTILVYGTGLKGPFLLDDLACIVNNPTIKDIGLAFQTFGDPAAISDGSFTFFSYRPLLPIIYASIHWVFGLNSWAYHLLNILIHSLNAVLVFYLIFKITKHPVASFASTAWWTFHAVHVEAVQSASGTDDILNATFMISALLLLLKKRPWLALLAFSFALLSKEAAVVGPGLVFIVMFWKNDGTVFKKSKNAIWTAIPFAVLSIIYIFIRSNVNLGLKDTNAPIQNLAESLIILPKIFLTYLRIMIIPQELRINYYFSVDTQISTSVIIGYLVIIALIVSALLNIKKRPLISLGIFWFFILFFPVSNLIPIRAIVGERFMYLPFVGAAIIIAFIATKIRWKRKCFWGIWLILLVIMAIGTTSRVKVWCDEEVFWKDIIKKEPGFRVYQMYETNLANYYVKNKRFEQAEVLFIEALKQKPANKKAASNLAQFFYLVKKHKPAMMLFKQLMDQYPDNPMFGNFYKLSKTALENSTVSTEEKTEQ